ncbi:MAG: glycosyltransferase family 2 protein [Bacteroidetes bacterium]|nr:glycosyltransferase family 2 protein [Bacteroidota bacterium]
MKQFVSIIIVNFNGKHFLNDCISSVMPQCADRAEIIVVDNGSKDGSADYLKQTFPSVRLIESMENLGFAGGNNLGVNHANGNYIVLLNNDTKVNNGWLDGLVKAISDDRIVCASSLIKTEGIPDRYYEKNGSINFLGHNIMRVFDEPTDIFFAGGASLIFKKEIIGLPFDADYFVYAEDVYLSLRSRFMGYQIRHTNESTLEHFGSGTSKTQKTKYLSFYQERNRILNTFLFFSPSTIIKVLPLLCINAVVKCCASLIGMKYSIRGIVRAYGWFFVHRDLIKQKRATLLLERKVDEKEVIRYMSGKLTNGESIIGKVINTISLAYCALVGLKVIELKR